MKTKFLTLAEASSAVDALNTISNNGDYFYTYNGTDFDIYWVPNEDTVLAAK